MIDLLTSHLTAYHSAAHFIIIFFSIYTKKIYIWYIVNMQQYNFLYERGNSSAYSDTKISLLAIEINRKKSGRYLSTYFCRYWRFHPPHLTDQSATLTFHLFIFKPLNLFKGWWTGAYPGALGHKAGTNTGWEPSCRRAHTLTLTPYGANQPIVCVL